MGDHHRRLGATRPFLVARFAAIVVGVVRRGCRDAYVAESLARRRGSRGAGSRRAELAAEAAEPVAADGYTVIEETVLRAWQASVLSMSFPPLALYAIWLLLRLKLPEEPLKPREQRRYLGAWIFSMLSIAAFYGLFVWLPLHLR